MLARHDRVGEAVRMWTPVLSDAEIHYNLAGVYELNDPQAGSPAQSIQKHSMPTRSSPMPSSVCRLWIKIQVQLEYCQDARELKFPGVLYLAGGRNSTRSRGGIYWQAPGAQQRVRSCTSSKSLTNFQSTVSYKYRGCSPIQKPGETPG